MHTGERGTSCQLRYRNCAVGFPPSPESQTNVGSDQPLHNKLQAMPLAGFGGKTAMRYARLQWKHDALKFMNRWTIDISQLMPFLVSELGGGTRSFFPPGVRP